MSDVDGDALKSLKKKLKTLANTEQTFGGKPLVLAVIDEVSLAQVSPKKGKSDPDWDPLDHPKDSEGKFTEKHSATFKGLGEAKTAFFTNKYGSVSSATLQPGDKLHEVPSVAYPDKMNQILEKSDGSLLNVSMGENSATTVSPKSTSGKKVKDPTVDTVIDENSAATTASVKYTVDGKEHAVSLGPGEKLHEVVISPTSTMYAVEAKNGSFKVAPGQHNAGMAVPATSFLGAAITEGKSKVIATVSKPPQAVETLHENTADHPALNINAEGGTVFIHPVSGVTVDLKPGQTFYQHKKSLDSFILVDAGGETGTFFNKYGKAIASNPSTKVWTLKNYNKIWSATSADATEKAQAQLKEEPKKLVVKEMQEVPDDASSVLADWEKELLGVSPSVTPKDSFVLPGDYTYALKAGETLYTNEAKVFYILVDSSGKPQWWDNDNDEWSHLSKDWWADQNHNYHVVAGAAPAKPVFEVSTGGVDDGKWGAIQHPQGGKIELKPGDKVYAHSLTSGFEVTVLSPGPNDQSGVGKYYSPIKTHHFVQSQEFFKDTSVWQHVVDVPLGEAPPIKKGKSLGVASTDSLSEVVHSGVASLNETLVAGQSSSLTYAITDEKSFVKIFANEKARVLAANLVATIDDFSDKAPSYSIDSFRQALFTQLQLIELSQLLAAGSTDAAVIESRWAHVHADALTMDVPWGFPWSPSLTEHLVAAVETWRFNQKLSAELGFDLNTAPVSQKHQFMIEKGFSAAGALDDAQSTQWIEAHFKNATSKKKNLEALASYKVVSTQAELQLKKILKVKPVEKSLTPADKAIVSQTKSFQESLKKLAVSYTNDAETISYKGPDEWQVFYGNEPTAMMTTAGLLQVLESTDGWQPSSLGTIGGQKLFQHQLQDWEKSHGVSLQEAPKNVLNTYIKSNGGNYVALMKASHKQDWIRFHLVGDEVAKWTLEHALADKSYGQHKWESTHPGSWGSESGKAARQSISDFLMSQEWFTDLADQLGVESPDWGGAYLLSNTQTHEAFTALGLETQYGKKSSPAARREAIAWWLDSRGRLPDSLAVSFAEPLQEPAKVAPETSEAPALPPNIDQTAWDLVLAAENGVEDIKKLEVDPEHLATFSLTAAGLDPNNDYPPMVKHLAAWVTVPASYPSNKELGTAKRIVRDALKARAKSGIWAPPSYTLLESHAGSKHPLAPGSEVYNYGQAFIVIPVKGDAYTISDGGNVSSFDVNDLQDYAPGAAPFLKAPKPLTLVDAQADKNLTVTQLDWDAVAQIEAYTPEQVTLPGYSLATHTPASLVQFISNHPSTPPYLKANAEKVPDQIKLLSAWVLTEKHQPTIDLIEWKLKNGHYASTSTQKLLDSSAVYYSYLMKGKFTPDDVWSSWPNSVTDALAKDLNVKAKDDFWSPAELEKLYTAILSVLAPSQLTPASGTSSKTAFPETLTLKPIAKSLGGMHTKQVWTDQFGNEWMSKGFKNDPNSGARVDAEHVAMVIGRLFSTKSPETRTMQLEGLHQYVQYLKPAKGDLSGRSPESLTEEQLSQAMEEHVLDWLNSNHDSHPMNLLLDPNGKDIIPIDKGQAWRFFGEDKLAAGYLPPSNPVAVWYDQFYYAVQGGQVDKDRLSRVAKRVLAKAYKVQSKHDTEVRDLLGQAFDKRVEFPSGYSNKQQLVDGVMARKAALLSDFEAFYKSLFKSGGYVWDIDVDQLKKPQINSHIHTSVTDQFVSDVSKSGVYGKSLMFDSKDLEDAHLVVYTEKTQAGKDLAGQGLVRQDADKVITSWLKSQLVQNETNVNSYNSPQSTDYYTAQQHAVLPKNEDWFSSLVSGAKTVNHHAVDKEYNQGTLSNLKEAQEQMQKALTALQSWEKTSPEKPFKWGVYQVYTAEQQAAWKAMLERYIEDVDRIFAAKDDGTKVVPHVVMVEYTPTEGLNTSGTPKASVVLRKGTDSITVWDDLNYTLHQEDPGTVKKLTVNEYKTLIEDGGWKLKPPSDKAVEGETEVWTATPKKGAKVSWTKTPGSEVWTNESSAASMTDDQLQQLIATSPQLWAFEGPEVDQEAEVSVGQKTFKVFKRASYATEGKFDYTSGELDASGQHQSGQTGYQYDIEYGNVLIQYRPWTEPGVARSQQGLLRFKVKEWDGSTNQVEDVLDTLRTIGLNLSEADEESLQLYYWRHLHGIMQERNDTYTGKWAKVTESIQTAQANNANMSSTEELAAWKEAWTQALGQDVVETADWAPKFSRFNTHVFADDSEFTAGHPYWHRPDVTLDTVKSFWKTKTAMSAVGQHNNMANIILSGGMLSTEERIRVLGQWISGMSSSEDQTEGSGGWVFSRQNLPSSAGHVFYHPRVALRTSNYSWNHDYFGKSYYRKDNATFDPASSFKHTAGGNELMIKHGLSFLDDVAAVILPSPAAREKVLKRYKELGITELHGIPIEEIFVLNSTDAQKTVGKVWEAALKEAKQ